MEAKLVSRQNFVAVLLDVRDDLPHLQDWLIGRHIEVGLIGENHDSVDGNIVVEYKPSQGFDMTGILPQGVPQLMLLGRSIAFVSPIWEILLPELSITAAIDFSVYILCLYHEDTVA